MNYFQHLLESFGFLWNFGHSETWKQLFISLSIDTTCEGGRGQDELLYRVIVNRHNSTMVTVLATWHKRTWTLLFFLCFVLSMQVTNLTLIDVGQPFPISSLLSNFSIFSTAATCLESKNCTYIQSNKVHLIFTENVTINTSIFSAL